VAAAYGWPADLSDEEMLRRLLALNLERAGKSTSGLPATRIHKVDQLRFTVPTFHVGIDVAKAKLDGAFRKKLRSSSLWCLTWITVSTSL